MDAVLLPGVASHPGEEAMQANEKAYEARPFFPLVLETTATLWPWDQRPQSGGLGGRGVRLLSLQTFDELRHKVMEDLEIHCRAAEPEANSQMLGL